MAPSTGDRHLEDRRIEDRHLEDRHLEDRRIEDRRIEDYALLGNRRTAALVHRDGSVDWWCPPRFDSPACFAALLGRRREHGHFTLAPASAPRATSRRYRDGALVLETRHRTDGGEVAVLDALVADGDCPRLVRLVRGVTGRVEMRAELRVRFDYGSIVPWVTRTAPGQWRAVAGPDALVLRTTAPARGEDLATVATFAVAAGDEVPFELSWFPSHEAPPDPVHVAGAIDATERWWHHWRARCRYDGPWAGEVRDSLTVLEALTYAPTGGIVAAPTTSLPEQLGGTRNWDYRYCWLRDATFTLLALVEAGYVDEAARWRDWLLRAVAGQPERTQVLYGVAGERRLTECELDWLPGLAGSAPVRVGNAASAQLQLDVYGEVTDALYHARRHGLEVDDDAWRLQRLLLDFLEGSWREPDEGIWEVRGGRRQFTYSKVMAWVAADRAVRTCEQFDTDGPVDRWRALRADIHREVCERAVDGDGVFRQSYGSTVLDAAALVVPAVGFLPAHDDRVRATVAAVERELLDDYVVRRYSDGGDVDGLPGGEGAFLLCTFWLVDAYTLGGRRDDARALFARLLALRNDVGLLAEEYDPHAGRMLGNFPQAFSHLGLVNAATALGASATAGGARTRATAGQRR